MQFLKPLDEIITDLQDAVYSKFTQSESLDICNILKAFAENRPGINPGNEICDRLGIERRGNRTVLNEVIYTYIV